MQSSAALGARPARTCISVLFGLGMWLFTELLGWTGGVLLLYAVIVSQTKESWAPIERWASPLSAFLTLVGTAIPAAAIYFHSDSPRRPWISSKWIVSPIVMLSCVVGIVLLCQGRLSQVSVTAFGLLAISGGLKRLLRYPIGND